MNDSQKVPGGRFSSHVTRRHPAIQAQSGRNTFFWEYLRESKRKDSRLIDPVVIESVEKRVEESIDSRETIAEKPAFRKPWVPTWIWKIVSGTEFQIHNRDLPLDNHCKQILAYATEESATLIDKVVNENHLLIGVLRVPDCNAAKELSKAGLSLEIMRERLKVESRLRN